MVGLYQPLYFDVNKPSCDQSQFDLFCYFLGCQNVTNYPTSLCYKCKSFHLFCSLRLFVCFFCLKRSCPSVQFSSVILHVQKIKGRLFYQGKKNEWCSLIRCNTHKFILNLLNTRRNMKKCQFITFMNRDQFSSNP